jgi:hypothetical protein
MLGDMPEKAVGRCPECGRLFDAYGTATLYLRIGGHLYEEHDYPTRFWSPNSNHSPNRYPAPVQQRLNMPVAGSAAAVPFDEAFYDGARLTLYDRGFLRLLKIGWPVPPKKALYLGQ